MFPHVMKGFNHFSDEKSKLLYENVEKEKHGMNHCIFKNHNWAFTLAGQSLNLSQGS